MLLLKYFGNSLLFIAFFAITSGLHGMEWIRKLLPEKIEEGTNQKRPTAAEILEAMKSGDTDLIKRAFLWGIRPEYINKLYNFRGKTDYSITGKSDLWLFQFGIGPDPDWYRRDYQQEVQELKDNTLKGDRRDINRLFLQAFWFNDLPNLIYILDHYEDEISAYTMQTIFNRAAIVGRLDFVQVIYSELSKMRDFYTQMRLEPLRLAAVQGHVRIVQFLLDSSLLEGRRFDNRDIQDIINHLEQILRLKPFEAVVELRPNEFRGLGDTRLILFEQEEVLKLLRNYLNTAQVGIHLARNVNLPIAIVRDIINKSSHT